MRAMPQTFKNVKNDVKNGPNSSRIFTLRIVFI